MHDNLVRRLAKQLRSVVERCSRSLSEMLNELRRTLSRLTKTIKPEKNFIDEKTKADKENRSQPLPVVPPPGAHVTVHTDKETSKRKSVLDRILKGTEILGIFAVIIYSVLTYQMWREMISGTDIAGIGLTETRRSRNESDKAFKASMDQLRQQTTELAQMAKAARQQARETFRQTQQREEELPSADVDITHIYVYHSADKVWAAIGIQNGDRRLAYLHVEAGIQFFDPSSNTPRPHLTPIELPPLDKGAQIDTLRESLMITISSKDRISGNVFRITGKIIFRTGTGEKRMKDFCRFTKAKDIFGTPLGTFPNNVGGNNLTQADDCNR